jgi:hypothetical protein
MNFFFTISPENAKAGGDCPHRLTDWRIRMTLHLLLLLLILAILGRKVKVTVETK